MGDDALLYIEIHRGVTIYWSRSSCLFIAEGIECLTLEGIRDAIDNPRG